MALQDGEGPEEVLHLRRRDVGRRALPGAGVVAAVADLAAERLRPGSRAAFAGPVVRADEEMPTRRDLPSERARGQLTDVAGVDAIHGASPECLRVHAVAERAQDHLVVLIEVRRTEDDRLGAREPDPPLDADLGTVVGADETRGEEPELPGEPAPLGAGVEGRREHQAAHTGRLTGVDEGAAEHFLEGVVWRREEHPFDALEGPRHRGAVAEIPLRHLGPCRQRGRAPRRAHQHARPLAPGREGTHDFRTDGAGGPDHEDIRLHRDTSAWATTPGARAESPSERR